MNRICLDLTPLLTADSPADDKLTFARLETLQSAAEQAMQALKFRTYQST